MKAFVCHYSPLALKEVSCAAAAYDQFSAGLHVCGVDLAGKLVHMIRYSNGKWTGTGWTGKYASDVSTKQAVFIKP